MRCSFPQSTSALQVTKSVVVGPAVGPFTPLQSHAQLWLPCSQQDGQLRNVSITVLWLVAAFLPETVCLGRTLACVEGCTWRPRGFEVQNALRYHPNPSQCQQHQLSPWPLILGVLDQAGQWPVILLGEKILWCWPCVLSAGQMAWAVAWVALAADVLLCAGPWARLSSVITVRPCGRCQPLAPPSLVGTTRAFPRELHGALILQAFLQALGGARQSVTTLASRSLWGPDAWQVCLGGDTIGILCFPFRRDTHTHTQLPSLICTMGTLLISPGTWGVLASFTPGKLLLNKKVKKPCRFGWCPGWGWSRNPGLVLLLSRGRYCAGDTEGCVPSLAEKPRALRGRWALWQR